MYIMHFYMSFADVFYYHLIYLHLFMFYKICTMSEMNFLNNNNVYRIGVLCTLSTEYTSPIISMLYVVPEYHSYISIENITSA